MAKRIKLQDRLLPVYSGGEEIMNMVTHIVGGGISILAASLCILKTAFSGKAPGIISSAIYSFALIAVYTISSVYHGLKSSTGKKVMQVIDHCAIYFLIAGTYTPIMVCAFIPAYPVIGWSILVVEWALTTIAVTLTAIDLHHYRTFSMICYIVMGWCIIPFCNQTMQVLSPNGFYWLLAGGIFYTIGAILFGLGTKKKWMHSVFHIFVVLGSLFHLITIFFYVI